MRQNRNTLEQLVVLIYPNFHVEFCNGTSFNPRSGFSNTTSCSGVSCSSVSVPHKIGLWLSINMPNVTTEEENLTKGWISVGQSWVIGSNL